MQPDLGPIGIMPKTIWADKYPSPSILDYWNRFQELAGAIYRFTQDGRYDSYVATWVIELNEINQRFMKVQE